MESTSYSKPRFRFRDHDQEMADHESSEGRSTADSSYISSHEDEDTELRSMTAKGIQHLCSELLELKQESDEDFQKNIYSNYTAFLAILNEVEILSCEVVGLKHQASSQKKLVQNLIDGISLQVLSAETIETMVEEPLNLEPSSPNILETHTEKVAEMLDTLLSEHRLQDALVLLKMEGEIFQNLFSGEKFSSNGIKFYHSVISEKRAILYDQYSSMAIHSRVSAPELQKALLGLSQLGETHLATRLLLQYYHSRIASRIYDVQSSKELTDVSYVQETARLVCSMISQCARCFVALNGENHAQDSELTQWADKEIKFFSSCFEKYVSSIPQINGRFVLALDTVQIAMSYCSLLEPQRLFLQPSLIEHVRPCIEEVLRSHINHLSKVVGIFTSSDTWVLHRYLVSGILTGRNQGIIDELPEYISLSNSGRKFMTVFQSLADEVSPLISLQMESWILKGILDLFVAYIVILESALTGDTYVLQKEGLSINLPESPTQEIYILANLSTLMQFSSSIIRNIFEGIHGSEFEIHNFLLFVQDVYGRLRAGFFKQYMKNILSPDDDHQACSSESRINRDESTIHDLIPSVPYLELYFELKKLEKLANEDCMEKNWLMGLLRELADAVFKWISSKSKIWTVDKQDLSNNREEFIQLILDSQFLVEIARQGGYLSDNARQVPMDFVSHLEASSTTGGLEPLRGLNDDGWPANAATKALLKLQELEAKKTVENENDHSIVREESYECAAGKDPAVSVLDPLTLDASESDDEDNEGKTDAEVSRTTNNIPLEEGRFEVMTIGTQNSNQETRNRV
ncbi:exocyst complex component EXO84A-like [Primulina tabacum]|uniref:exocyst complex component EXO84A-like n=1 Tax=Primulina tabacum TaxID=48773 RepID=UPI003F59D9C1